MKYLIIFTILLIFGTFAYRQQTLGIRGQLMCGSKPLNDARIKVSNKNRLGKCCDKFKVQFLLLLS